MENRGSSWEITIQDKRLKFLTIFFTITVVTFLFCLFLFHLEMICQLFAIVNIELLFIIRRTN